MRRIVIKGIMGMFFIVVFGLVGCGLPALMTDTKSYSTERKIELPKENHKILDIVADVGKDMGYDVTDDSENSITIGYESGGIISGRLGTGSQKNYQIAVSPSGKVLQVRIIAVGNFGSADRKSVDKLFTEFKRRLLAKIEIYNSKQKPK